MRALLILAVLALCGCEKKAIHPSAVELVDGKLHATFTLKADSAGIESNGHGGACLMTDMGIYQECQNNFHCDKAILSALHPQLNKIPGLVAECIGAENGKMRCAFKGAPDSAWCTKYPPSTTPPSKPALTLGHPYTLPNDTNVVSLSNVYPGGRAKWVVSTCLNAIDPATKETIKGCGEPGDQGEVYGVGEWREVFIGLHVPCGMAGNPPCPN